MNSFSRYHVAVCGLALLYCASSHAQTISYEKQIAPLLENYCLDCHGDTDADGEFRLDTFANLLVGGKTGKALVTGKSGESLLVKFLEGKSGVEGKNQFMPPGKRDKMKPEEIALIKAWIDAGAKGPIMAETKPAGPREVITPKIAPKGVMPRSVQAAAFSAKVQLVAIGRYGEVELLNPVTRAVIRKLAGFKGKANAVAFSPDGMWLYGAGGEAGIGGEVYRWRVTDGELTQRYMGHTDACYGLAVSPDGKVLATGGYDQRIRLWDPETGKELAVLKGHNGAINGLAFRPDGKILASASADRTVKLWALPKGDRLDTLSQPTKEQAAVVFSQDGKQLFAGGSDNRIRVWSISPAAKEGANPILTSRYAHEGAILNLVLSPDGKMLASAASDKSVKIWNAADLTEKVPVEKQPDWSPALAFNDKAQLFVGRLNGTLATYASADGKVVMAPKPVMPAKPVKLELTSLAPRAVGAGGNQTITLTGKNFKAEGLVIKMDQPSLSAELIAGSVKPTQAQVRVTAAATVPRGAYDIWLSNAVGASTRLKVYVDDIAPITTSAASFAKGPVILAQLPASLWGTLSAIGQHDVYRLHAKAGEDLVFDLSAAQVQSKAKSPALEILDANATVLVVNRGLDSGSDPFIAWKAPADGDYEVHVSNTTMDGSAEHSYRLTIGALPYVTGWSPLSAQVGKDVKVTLIGHHLGDKGSVMVKTSAEGSQPVPVDAKTMRVRGTPMLRVNALPHVDELEGNDDVKTAQAVTLPVTVNGSLYKAGAAATTPDVDCFAFDAKAGQPWVMETLAAMAGSPADTKIEVLHTDGQPVARVQLQAVRDSYNNFRSVDANNPDIRLQNWEEMELNEYVYFNGDVMRIFRMPRGPDGGTFFYTTNNIRRSYFDTSATAHTFDEPCYIVEPKPLGAKLVPNGLPVFTLNYANDDSGDRKLGRDSRLTFTAPKDGRYLVRVTDTRGWSGPRFVYALTLRPAQPDFSIKLTGTNPTVSPGSSIGFSLRVDRRDDFDGPISVDITGVPEGYFVSSPLIIEAGHTLAAGSLHAAPSAKADADWSRLAIRAHAAIAGAQVTHEVETFGKVTLGPAPQFVLVLEPDQNGKPVMRALGAENAPLEITIAPGQTVKAWLRTVRTGNDGLVNLDIHNLPHGIIVDDIGLNGVQIREKENERPFFFRAAKWVAEQDRLCHGAISSARAEQDSAGLQTSFPIVLKVRKDRAVSAK